MTYFLQASDDFIYSETFLALFCVKDPTFPLARFSNIAQVMHVIQTN